MTALCMGEEVASCVDAWYASVERQKSLQTKGRVPALRGGTKDAGQRRPLVRLIQMAAIAGCPVPFTCFCIQLFCMTNATGARQDVEMPEAGTIAGSGG